MVLCIIAGISPQVVNQLQDRPRAERLADHTFDIADLMAHPTFIGVPSERWAWVIRAYGDLVDDPTMAIRIEAYYQTLLVWWVARSARLLYEVPRGLDNRLASRPTAWQAKTRMQYDHYLNLAESMLNIWRN